MVRMMTHYMAWANTTMFNSVSRISDTEIVKERQTLFGNIAHTFNHILVVQNIFHGISGLQKSLKISSSAENPRVCTSYAYQRVTEDRHREAFSWIAGKGSSDRLIG